MIEKILLIYISYILNGCNKENPADNSKEEEIIYVSSGSFVSPFYKFYSDEEGKNQINENGILKLNSNKIYTFRRFKEATSHPFDIKINNDNEDLEDFELIKNNVNGIKGSESLTIEFKNYQDKVEIIYYCTKHPNTMKKKIYF